MNLKQRNVLFKKYGEPDSLDSLGYFVIKVINEKEIVTGFKWDVRFSPKVSNSHSCPIAGVSNFSGHKNLPTGYPGFTGRVWIRYLKEPEHFASDTFSKTCTHTGTGGFGSYNGPFDEISHVFWERNRRPNKSSCDFLSLSIYSWDYRFYIQDFPLIQKAIEEQKIVDILSNKTTSWNHTFEWYDQEQLKADNEYIRQM
jgi:hypothetical protein